MWMGGRRVASAARLQDVEETLGGHGLCRGFPMLCLLFLVPLVLGAPVLEPHLHLAHGTVISVRNREIDQEWWLTGTSQQQLRIRAYPPPPPTHTHTRTHARTCMHTRTHEHTHCGTHARTHARIHIRTSIA